MGHVILVRHGQASVQGPSYDALSELGHAQATLLGQHWADLGVQFDSVYVGPRLRHAQTAERVAEVYRSRGLAWPAPQPLGELDEHHGLSVLKRAAGIHEPGDSLLTGEEDRDQAIRQLFGRYREIMTEWAAGGFAHNDIEPWRAFRARAGRVIDAMCHGHGRSVAFTSGGLIAAAVGTILSLDDHQVIRLSAEVQNTALTELRHRPGEIGLSTFNTIPHLRDAASITRI